MLCSALRTLHAVTACGAAGKDDVLYMAGNRVAVAGFLLGKGRAVYLGCARKRTTGLRSPATCGAATRRGGAVRCGAAQRAKAAQRASQIHRATRKDARANLRIRT